MFSCEGCQIDDDNEILNKWIGSTIYALAAPITTAVFLVDPLIRTICSVASILSLGKLDGVNQAAAYGRGPTWHNAGYVFVILHSVVVHMLNPWAKFESADAIYGDRINSKQENPDGYLTANYAIPLLQKARGCVDDKEVWKARGYYLLGTMAITATKILEFTVGLIAAAFSVGTVGLIPQLNDFATEYLCAFDGIHRLFTGLRAIINPEQTFLDFGRELSTVDKYDEDVGCCTPKLPTDDLWN